ncbi:MAG: Stp1/IreP family PP2C-type Ser/Thr phosphatase [Gammaproteobacteria bacterium]
MHAREADRIGPWIRRWGVRLRRCYEPFGRPREAREQEGPRWEVSARSETGYVREENQDRMSRARVGLGEAYVIADGMGGHNGGALAAELTVNGVQQSLATALPELTVAAAITQAFDAANSMVYERAGSGDPETEGMGSTALLLLTSGSLAYVAHVGDSRAYLYRKRELRQLTTDHTRVQRMVEAGMLSAEEGQHHPEASILERAMGHRPQVEVDIGTFELREGDGILLCSDGLSGYVDDEGIEAVLRSRATVQEVADRLVELALDRGGQDNVTVQFIQYGERTQAHTNGSYRWYRLAAGALRGLGRRVASLKNAWHQIAKAVV